MAEYILGEGVDETARLRAQAADIPALARIQWAGLKSGSVVVDAGCGPGEISRTLAALAGPTGRIEAFDLSEGRLDAARAVRPEPGSAPIHYRQGDICDPPVDPGTADFVFSQFVFEYLVEPQRAIASLLRTLKPGGVLCVCDIDGMGGTNWPEPEAIGAGLKRMLDLLATTGFDPRVGRKLFTLMVDAGLRDVRARIDPLVIAGAAPPNELANWERRFAGLAPLGEKAFGSLPAYQAFVIGYSAMLNDPRVFKFSEIISVAGVKA